jgi:hypothetical protein
MKLALWHRLKVSELSINSKGAKGNDVPRDLHIMAAFQSGAVGKRGCVTA